MKINRFVMTICGPIWNNGRSSDPHNVRIEPDEAYWPHQHANEIEDDLGLVHNSLVFLNDFEAIGQCLVAQLDPHAVDFCKPTNMLVVHQVTSDESEEMLAPVACLGAGTGLGACYLVPDDSGRHHAYPSVAGMTETFCPRSDEEWALLNYLRRNQSFIEIEQFVSGPGLVAMFEFYSHHLGQPLSSTLAGELNRVPQDDAPSVIARHARDHNDPVCLRVIDLFLDIFGRVLGTVAQTFLPYRGLYIAGGILPKLVWRWNTTHEHFLLKSYLDQGPKMSDVVARVSLVLIDDVDLGMKRYLYYLLTHDSNQTRT